MSLPDPTLVLGVLLEDDDYEPRNPIWSSQLLACPRAQVYRWTKTPRREETEQERILRELRFASGRNAEARYAVALEKLGLLKEAQVSFTEWLPDHVGGTADFIVDYGDGLRISEYKEVHPNVHFDSLPYLSHVCQVASYWIFAPAKYKTVPPEITYEPAGGRGGPLLNFEVKVTTWVETMVRSAINRLQETYDHWAKDPTWLPPVQPCEVQADGKTKVIYAAPYTCSTRWCDWCADGQGHGTCIPNLDRIVLRKRVTRNKVQVWEDQPEAVTYRAELQQFYAAERERLTHQELWRVEEHAPLPELRVVAD